MKKRHLFLKHKVEEKKKEGWKVIQENIGVNREQVLMEKGK